MRLLLATLALLAGCAKTDGDHCFEWARLNLKDAKSAELVSWHKVGTTTKVEMRASNSYGAFRSVYAACKIDGQFILTEDRVKWSSEQ